MGRVASRSYELRYRTSDWFPLRQGDDDAQGCLPGFWPTVPRRLKCSRRAAELNCNDSFWDRQSLAPSRTNRSADLPHRDTDADCFYACQH